MAGVAAGQEFWLVATGCSKTGSGQQEKDSYFELLSNQRSLSHVWRLQVPDGDRSLMFGSFDNLIRLTDELHKCDTQVDSIVHRLERQWAEIDPKARFQVKSQRVEKSFLDYIKDWQWDEAKYPRTRQITDNLTHLMTTVNKIDEEARNKTLFFNEAKSQKANLTKKEGMTLPSRDLVDVLTPDVVKMTGSASDDFIQTEHIATVVVILPRGAEAEFLKAYSTLCENVVPMSAKKFPGLDDKDGNTLWRVVCFKSVVEEFKKACKEKRFIPRDFEYSEELYKKLTSQRSEIEEAVKKQHTNVRGLYQAAWSDTMVAWMHIKAMRIFVESVLRFGMPPKFAAFTVTSNPGQQANARKGLAERLGRSPSSSEGTYSAEKMAEAAGEDGDEYFPYVSFSFTPFASGSL